MQSRAGRTYLVAPLPLEGHLPEPDVHDVVVGLGRVTHLADYVALLHHGVALIFELANGATDGLHGALPCGCVWDRERRRSVSQTTVRSSSSDDKCRRHTFQSRWVAVQSHTTWLAVSESCRHCEFILHDTQQDLSPKETPPTSSILPALWLRVAVANWQIFNWQEIKSEEATCRQSSRITSLMSSHIMIGNCRSNAHLAPIWGFCRQVSQ